MIDIEKIKSDYEKLKLERHTGILPFDRVVVLENTKQEIIEKYISKITKINPDFSIAATSNFTIDEMIKEIKSKFGDLNFFDTTGEEGKLSIDLAFNFCIISISYFQEKLKYRFTVFWDM